jgi:hypothetical protein
VRDRCVIVAVQTTLKPLLDAGVRPHFVTALDYHEISRRFYEGIEPADVEGVTLVVDPKAHPAILESFPGPVRCCASKFLDRLLGDLRRDMGQLPAGATVAHLAVYLARWLGCDPIATIGQDLGFPDGLYYAPGTAIHDVWSPELNPFNTIAMMEWQRIVRYRVHLNKTVDVDGKSIYTDAQMRTYQQQFERDFAAYAREGVHVIDATEGGVAKQHVENMPLAAVLERHATRPLPTLPLPDATLDRDRLDAAEQRFARVEHDVERIGAVSRRTARLIERMQRDQGDDKRMERHFKAIEQERDEIRRRKEAFDLIESLNQLGTFKRLRADRKLHVRSDLDPVDRQREQLERDHVNVSWIADAAHEMTYQLAAARRVLRGEDVDRRPHPAPADAPETDDPVVAAETRVAALVPVDLARNGLGIERSLATPCGGRPVLQATLERLGAATSIESIVLVAAPDADVDALIDRDRIGRPVHVERVEGGPFGAEQEAIAAARLWARTSWRGGIAGMSVYDEALGPAAMLNVMERRAMTAAVVAAPDWPWLDAGPETGVDALVARYREHPDHHSIVFTQAPPGLSGCLVTADAMRELARRNRIATVGGLLVYQPHAPQDDPIGRDGNVQIDHAVRHALCRATFDTPRQVARLERALADVGPAGATPAAVIAALGALGADPWPEHVELELTTRRRSHGVLARHPFGPVDRAPLDRAVAERVFAALGAAGDAVVTFGGLGDPLLHPEFDRLVAAAKDAGVRAVHVRTELLEDTPVLDRLLASGVDVVSVDLHADCAATYRTMMGEDHFKAVLVNIQHLVRNRRVLTDAAGSSGFALPWIVPRLQRRAETYEDIDTFFDRWQHLLGTVVLEPPPPYAPNDACPADTLAEAVTPAKVVDHMLRRRMTILSDGSVPVSELDRPGVVSAGNVGATALEDVWAALVAARATHHDPPGLYRP